MVLEKIRRRHFLTLLAGGMLLGVPAGGSGQGQPGSRSDRRGYTLEVSILYGLVRFTNQGSITEDVMPSGGTYRVTVAGEGTGSTIRVESVGELRGGRWVPVTSDSRFVIRNRQSKTSVRYDYQQRLITFAARAETFFLGRERVVNDTIAIGDARVDDAISALLNLEHGRWAPEPGGVYRTHIVRRQRRAGERPDDVDQKGYRAELAPLEFTLTGSTATLDLTRFSSWASEEKPGRVVFGADRRPRQIEAALMLGTHFTIVFTPPEGSA